MSILFLICGDQTLKQDIELQRSDIIHSPSLIKAIRRQSHILIKINQLEAVLTIR